MSQVGLPAQPLQSSISSGPGSEKMHGVGYEVEGPRPKRTWRELVKKDCQTRKLNKEDAADRSRWRKLMRDV